MADEVTKKDLQSLQAYCNKQIAEVAKKVDSLAEEFEAYKAMKEKYEISTVNAHNIYNDMRLKVEGELKARLGALEKRVDSLG
jgi:hypothetical protein